MHGIVSKGRRTLALLCCVLGIGAAWLRPAEAAAQERAASGPPDLPLPEIPQSLREPGQRAAYLIGHFWDEMDFSDIARSRSRDYMERQLVNFLSLFPHADTAAHAGAAERLVRQAERDPGAFRLVARLSEKYLFEPDSPLFSEELYLLFLDRITASALSDDPSLRRLRYQQEALRKNLPGTQAADIEYIGRDGGQTSLYRSGSGACLLLILYDADCAHCMEVMAELRGDDGIAQAVETGGLEVLAICLDSDREALLRSSADLPAAWMTGYETGGIFEEESYMIRSLPTLLLLDGEKRVLLRNTSPAGVREFLAVRAD